MIELDLHGKSHQYVEDNLANWLIVQYNRGNLPMKVITGKSERMKTIVHKICENYKFTVTKPIENNTGILIVR